MHVIWPPAQRQLNGELNKLAVQRDDQEHRRRAELFDKNFTSRNCAGWQHFCDAQHVVGEISAGEARALVRPDER
jgi:hypothetical protein